jgi:hypothetical protein
MATATLSPQVRRGATSLPPLENGDRLDQPTFHARYLAMPEEIRAELIGGVVYMSSPVKALHGRPHGLAVGWATVYAASIAGLDLLDNSTSILGHDSEPQPDLCLFTTGGQASITSDQYLAGAPDFACEVGNSTESIDLNAKKLDYEKYGVREYLVVAVRANRVFWFIRGTDGKFAELPPDVDGILRSRIYPGLWLDPAALLSGDRVRVLAVVNQGIASPEHAAFVAGLGTR